MLSDLTEIEKIGPSIQIILSLAFIIFGGFGNGLTIFAVFRIKKLSTPTNYFIANLAVADLIVCVFLDPFYVLTLIHQGWPLADEVCTLLGFMTALSVGVSMMNLAAIAINRYICIVKSIKYTEIFSTRNTAMFCCLTWIVTLAMVLPPLFGFGSYGFNTNFMACNFSSSKDSWKYLVSVLTTYFSFTSVIIIFCYYKIFKLVKTSSANIQTHLAKDQEISTQEQQKKSKIRPSDIKIAKNLLLITVVFALCLGPLMVLTIADVNGTTPVVLWRAFGILALANSMVNPLIYAWKNKAFRQAYLQTFNCNCVKFKAETRENVVNDDPKL